MPLYADVHASTSNTPPWRMHKFARNVHVVYLEMYINMYSMDACLNNAHEHIAQHTCMHICMHTNPYSNPLTRASVEKGRLRAGPVHPPSASRTL